jgi:hypothetical protein
LPVLRRRHTAGVIRKTTLRERWFLAQGAAAPLPFHALAQMLDPIDGPMDRDQDTDRMTDAIMRSMRVDLG